MHRPPAFARRAVAQRKTRLPKEFNLAAAETGLQDVWQSAEIGLVTVSNDDALVQSALETAVRWIERNAPDVEVADYKIELR